MVGLVFAKGAVTDTPALDISNYQVVVKRRWSDNSVKHAIASGHLALTANVPTTVTASDGSAVAGTPLTSADITAAMPTASFQAASIGTVTLTSLLATPFRTWISGPEMVECHYRSAVGSDTTLVVWFYVRLWVTGVMWVRVIAENGYIDVTNSNKSYVPSMVVGGTTVYNNGGATLTHWHNTRYMAEGWIGTANPAVTPKHDSTYLISTKLVPNYWKRNPSATVLNALTQTYTPLVLADSAGDMGAEGASPWIGLIPKWDALYITSGDSRAYHSSLTNSSAFNVFPLCWRNSSTKTMYKPSEFPTVGVDGVPSTGGGTAVSTNGSIYWDVAHSPSIGYLAYLITGDYWHYETLLMNAALNYMSEGNAGGSGINRIMVLTTRSVAWGLRTMGVLSAIYPTGDTIAAEYQTLFSNNIDHWKSIADAQGTAVVGSVWPAIDPGLAYGDGGEAPWMEHFLQQAIGFLSDLEPVSNLTNLVSLRNFLYRHTVGMLGGSSDFCFNYASAYKIRIATSNVAAEAYTFYADWATVFAQSVAAGDFISTGCTNTLKGDSGGNPAVPASYWQNLLPAIALAVDHGAPGAIAAYSRITGADNYSTFENSGFDDYPIWGIIPRSGVPTPAGWTEISNTHLLTVAPPDNFGGESYLFSFRAQWVVIAWNSGVFDTLRNRLICWGGGHNDYAGNELYAFNLSDNSIHRLNNPSVPTRDGWPTSEEATADGNANTRHTYDGLAYMPNIDSMFVNGGIPQSSTGNGGDGRVWLFNFATLAWSSHVPATVPNSSFLTTAYDPNRGHMFVHDSTRLLEYDHLANTFTVLNTYASISIYHTSVIDPVRKNMIILGQGDAFIIDISSGSSYVRQTYSTTGGSAVINAAWPGLAYDSVHDRVVGWAGGDTVYVLNLTTLVWSPVTYTGGPGAAQPNGTYKRWSYSPASDCFVLVNSMTQNVFTFRLP